MLLPKSQQGGTGGYSTTIAKAKRQRELAEALRKQSQQELAGTYTPFTQGTAEFGPLPQQYVAPHWTQQLARGVQAFGAARDIEEADRMEQEANRQAQEEAQQAMTNFPQIMKTRQVTETVPGEQIPVTDQQMTPSGDIMPGTMLPQARAQFKAGPEQTVTRDEQYEVPIEEYASDLAKFSAGLPMDNPYLEPIRQHALKQTLDMPTKIMEKREAAQIRAVELKDKYDLARDKMAQDYELKISAAKSQEEQREWQRKFQEDQLQLQENFRRDNMALQADLRRQGLDIQRGNLDLRQQLAQNETPAQAAARTKQEKVEEKVTQGKQNVNRLLDEMETNVGVLESSRGIPSTKNRALTNVGAWVQNTGLGQTLGKMTGTSNQRARNNIENIATNLVLELKNAKGLSASQMNSNMELQRYLQAVAGGGDYDAESLKDTIRRSRELLGGGGEQPTGGIKVLSVE